MNEKHIRFCIEAGKNWFNIELRKSDKGRKENIEISYADEEINLIDVADKKEDFTEIARKIVEDWTSVELSDRDNFVFGLSNLSKKFVFPTEHAEAILVEIVKSVLSRVFDEDFVKGYDEKTHEYLFDITFSINEKTCEAIDFTVEEYDKESIPKPTGAWGTYDVNFLTIITPKESRPTFFMYIYNSPQNSNRLVLEDFRYSYEKDPSIFFGSTADCIFKDWKNGELNKRGKLILGKEWYHDGVLFSIDKERLDFREIINKELTRVFPDEYVYNFDGLCHSYLFQLKILVKQNVSKLISSRVNDIQNDDSFDTPMMKSLNIDRNLLIDNYPKNYCVFDHPYNCPWTRGTCFDSVLPLD